MANLLIDRKLKNLISFNRRLMQGHHFDQLSISVNREIFPAVKLPRDSDVNIIKKKKKY